MIIAVYIDCIYFFNNLFIAIVSLLLILIFNFFYSRKFIFADMDQLLTLLFNDLTNEGLVKKSNQHKAVFLGDQEQEGVH